VLLAAFFFAVSGTTKRAAKIPAAYFFLVKST
jgi:hypothetical protein